MNAKSVLLATLCVMLTIGLVKADLFGSLTQSQSQGGMSQKQEMLGSLPVLGGVGGGAGLGSVAKVLSLGGKKGGKATVTTTEASA